MDFFNITLGASCVTYKLLLFVWASDNLFSRTECLSVNKLYQVSSVHLILFMYNFKINHMYFKGIWLPNIENVSFSQLLTLDWYLQRIILHHMKLTVITVGIVKQYYPNSDDSQFY